MAQCSPYVRPQKREERSTWRTSYRAHSPGVFSLFLFVTMMSKVFLGGPLRAEARRAKS
jgi:hypothetical protein